MKTGKPAQTLTLIALFAVCLSLGCNTQDTDAVAQAPPQAAAAKKKTPKKKAKK